MKENQAILVLVLIFLVSTALGVGGTWLVQNKLLNNAPSEGSMIAAGSSEKEKSKEGNTSGAVLPSVEDKTETQKKDRKKDKPTTEKKSEKVSLPADEPIKGQIDEIITESNKGVALDEPTPEIEINIPSDKIVLSVLEGPTPNSETRTYSLTASASGGSGGFTYYLYPARNAKDTLVSTTGYFANVRAASYGKYILKVKDKYGKEEKKELTGFYTIIAKLTTQQLTKRLSTSVPDKGLENHFAKGYSIKFDGLKSGDPIPTSYTQIYSNIASGYWKNVKVTSVEFNEYNKIKRIRLSVYYN